MTLKIEEGKYYVTREGEVVLAELVKPQTQALSSGWFPIKIRRNNGTYYTVTYSGKKLWNQENEEDLVREN